MRNQKTFERNRLISISGNATSGKDTLCAAITRVSGEFGFESERLSIAGDKLRTEMGPFFQEHFGIDIHRCSAADKEFFRPLLVEFGYAKRKITKGRYFLDFFEEKLQQKRLETPNKVFIVTDIRYDEYPEDEFWLVSKKYNAYTVFIERSGIGPANEKEFLNNSKICKKVDFQIWIPTYKENLEENMDKIARSVLSRVVFV